MCNSNILAMELMIKTMTEQMNAMITSMKENIPPANTRNKEVQGQGGGQGGGPREQQKKECPYCKTTVSHKPNNCTELEKNKDKRWKGWKLANDKTLQGPGTWQIVKGGVSMKGNAAIRNNSSKPNMLFP